MWQSCQLKTRPDSNVCVQQYPACFLQKTPTEKKRQEQDAVHVTVLFHTAGWTVFLLLQAGALTPPRQIGWNNTEGFLWEVKSEHAHVHTHTHSTFSSSRCEVGGEQNSPLSPVKRSAFTSQSEMFDFEAMWSRTLVSAIFRQLATTSDASHTFVGGLFF